MTTDPAQRPFVFINMAMSADGKIATANHAVHSFGSARDRCHLYELRATADAILCGARTLEMEGATLGNGRDRHRRARLKSGLAEFPLRVVVSGLATIQPDAAVFSTRFSPIIVLATKSAPSRRLAALRRVADSVLLFGGSEIDFLPALQCLYRKWNVRRLLCEGGGELNDALFRADLVDEIHLTVCPRIFGGAHAPSIAGGVGFQHLADAARFDLKSLQRHNGEAFLVLRRRR
jgi:riboflavin-specific deaminase-like protein